MIIFSYLCGGSTNTSCTRMHTHTLAHAYVHLHTKICHQQQYQHHPKIITENVGSRTCIDMPCAGKAHSLDWRLSNHALTSRIITLGEEAK